MITPQFLIDIRPELIVDLFAGGGGMSTAIEQATGLYPDIACNHDSDAISMHEANHPQTKHYQADVFELCPREATQGCPVGLLHASPDCTHHTLRMLEPHELYKAQGFPAGYTITHGHDGRKLSKSAQVRMCGNSVSPPPAAALISSNYQSNPKRSIN